MFRTVARVIVGLGAVLAAGVAVTPMLWPVGAEPGRRLPGLTTATSVIRSTTTIATVTTVTTLPTTPTSQKTTTTRNNRPRGTTTTTLPPDTTTVPPTTVAPLPAVAPPPVTLPLATTAQSGHVSAVFPILGGLGLVSFTGLLAAQWMLTKPGRRGPTL
jgi:hypothetical protein